MCVRPWAQGQRMQTDDDFCENSLKHVAYWEGELIE